MVWSLYKHQGFFGQLKLLNKQNLTYVDKYLHMISLSQIYDRSCFQFDPHLYVYGQGHVWAGKRVPVQVTPHSKHYYYFILYFL